MKKSQLVSIIAEQLKSVINENKDLNSYGKVLFDRLNKNGFEAKFVKSSSDFDKFGKMARETRDKKLAVVQYDDMGVKGDGFILIGVNNQTHDEVGEILDSIKFELPEGGRHMVNSINSWQVQGPSLVPSKKVTEAEAPAAPTDVANLAKAQGAATGVASRAKNINTPQEFPGAFEAWFKTLGYEPGKIGKGVVRASVDKVLTDLGFK
jgi:hypothetical protein